MKFKSLFKLSSFLLISLFTLAIFAGTAKADGKVYPATLCWSDRLFNSTLFHHWQGIASNWSGNWVETWCPMITDNEMNIQGLNHVRVRVNESTQGWAMGGTSCEVRAYDSDGQLFSSNWGMSGNSGNQTIDIVLSASPANAVYSLVCWMSGLSWVSEYEVEEP